MRDVRAIVTERWRRLRWTLQRQVISSPDETFAAYGEVVWFWRRDPGVKLARSIVLTTVAKQAAHRGEHEGNRKTIARESRDVSAVPVKPVCVFSLPIAHGAAGAAGARLSLPSVQGGRNEDAKPRADRVAGR